MASSDMTTLMLQMMKQMQEQQLAADERQRHFMGAILDRRADQTPAAMRSTIEKSPPIKFDFEEFSGEPEDWTTWSKVHQAQLSAVGCADALTETTGDETEVNRDDLDRGSVDPDQLHKAQQAWVSLVTSCKGVAFDIANAEESASDAWAKLVQHYQASGLNERRRLTIDFYMMKMELGGHPLKFLLRGSNDEGTGASGPARGPKGHRHCHPERTYTAVGRQSSHAKELIGLAHAGMDRACCDKPVRAAGKREICRRDQSDVVRPRPPPQRYTPHPMPPLLPHKTLCLEMPRISDNPP